MLSFLMSFVAGTILVAGLGHLHRRLIYRDPDLAGRRADIFELTDKRERVQAAEAELVVSEREQRDLAKNVEIAQQRSANRVPVADPPSAKYMWRQAGFVLAGGEALLLAMQAGSNRMAGLDPNPWAFLAPLIVATVVLLLHVLFGHIVTDHSRPARTARRAKRLFTVTATAVFLGGWLLTSGRSVDDANLLENLVGIGYMMVLGLLALTSTFALIVSSALFAAEDDARHLSGLTRLQMLYTQHLDLVKKDLARLKSEDGSDNQPPNPPTDTAGTPFTGPVAPAGVIPTLVIALMVLMPGFAWADQTGPAVNAVGRPATIHFEVARDGVCRILGDLSSSVENATWKTTFRSMNSLVPLMIDTLKCVTIQMAPFVGDPFLNLWEAQLPDVIDTTAECASMSAPAPTTTAARMTEFLYPKVRDQHRQDAIAKCMADRRSALNKQTAARASVVARVADQLVLMSNGTLGGPCTEIYNTVQQSALAAQTVVMLTDGFQTCPSARLNTALLSGTRLILLLVPTGNPKAADRAELLLNRVHELEKVFPGAIVAPASEALVSSFWRRLVLD